LDIHILIVIKRFLMNVDNVVKHSSDGRQMAVKRSSNTD
jgi:hypothetical protein